MPDFQNHFAAAITDTLLYTDSIIQIFVPSWLDAANGGSAASGKVQVTNALGKIATSDEGIDVIYSILNFRDEFNTAHRISHVNADGSSGGYVFYMDDELYNYNPINCINSALATWSCATGINWQLDTNNIVTYGTGELDGKSTLVFGDSLSEFAFLGDTSIAITTLQGHVKECTNDLAVGVAYVDDIDIVFNKNYNLQTDCGVTSGSYDFYPVLIHELSHGHMLHHVFDAGSIVYPHYNGITTPGSNDILAGKDAMNYNLSWEASGSCPPAHDTIQCPTNSVSILDHSSLIHIYPNPFSSEINIEILDNAIQNFEVSIHTLTGESLFLSKSTADNQNLVTHIHFTTELLMPPGIYLLTLKSEGLLLTYKMIKCPE